MKERRSEYFIPASWSVSLRSDEPTFHFHAGLLDHVVAIALSLRSTFMRSSLSPRVNPYLQGQSRRIQVEVRSVPDSGTMPLIAISILSVSIGDVKVRQMRPAKSSESQRVSHWYCQTGNGVFGLSCLECWSSSSFLFIVWLWFFLN